MGLLRAGVPAFLVSTRSTPLAAAALFSQTKPSVVLVSQDSTIRELADSAVEQFTFADTNGLVPEIHAMPTFEQLYLKDAPFSPLSPRKQDLGAPRIILHSSGELRCESSGNSC